MRNEREPEPNEFEFNPKDAYILLAMRISLEYEHGSAIVETVTRYVTEGFVDFEQAIFMLATYFEPDYLS